MPHETFHHLSTSQQDLLPCGHVCEVFEVCLRLQGNKNASCVADHGYYKRQNDNSNMSDQQESILSTNVEVSDVKMSDATSSTTVKTFNNPLCTPSLTGQCFDDSYVHVNLKHTQIIGKIQIMYLILIQRQMKANMMIVICLLLHRNNLTLKKINI